MIDNPLEQQTLETNDNLYINEKFEEHCTDAAKELAKDNNLHPDYYEPFIEFYIEECRESDRGYFFGARKADASWQTCFTKRAPVIIHLHSVVIYIVKGFVFERFFPFFNPNLTIS